MKVKITFDDKALNRQITAAMKAAPQQASKAMMDCVLDLSAESAKRAPIETGDLRSNCHGTVNSATVFENKQPVGGIPSPAEKAEGEVGYSLPYALRQHEDLSLRHSGPEHGDIDGGEAKFLENPFNERKDRYIQRFRRVVEDSIK